MERTGYALIELRLCRVKGDAHCCMEWLLECLCSYQLYNTCALNLNQYTLLIMFQVTRKVLLLCSILVNCTSVTEQSPMKRAPAQTHVFREHFPQLRFRTDLKKHDRAEHDHLHQVVFIIKQKNMEELTRILHDVSDPQSSNYGQHWTREDVVHFTSNPEARDAVVSYLNLNGVTVLSETLGGEMIEAEATIMVLEKILDTKYFTFHQTHIDGRIREVIAAESYSIPLELDKHVVGVSRAIDVTILSPVAPIPRKILKRNGNHLRRWSAADWTQSDGKDYGIITPRKIRLYYNMTFSTQGNIKSTQAVFASNGQKFSPANLLYFQKRYMSLSIQPVNLTIGNYSSDAYSWAHPDITSEANLDVQWLKTTSPRSPTTFWHFNGNFDEFLQQVANLEKPPLVITISYGQDELSVATYTKIQFNVQAIKLGAMGVTIFASSGDDGANGWMARSDPTKCGYQPNFPTTSPYVVSVGSTSVS